MVYTTFISYAFEDEKIKNTLDIALRSIDVQPKFYTKEEAIAQGDFIQHVINKLETSNALIPILTKNGAKSPAVNQEIGYAEKKGLDIIPLKVDRVERKLFIIKRHSELLNENDIDNSVNDFVEVVKKVAKLRDIKAKRIDENNTIVASGVVNKGDVN